MSRGVKSSQSSAARAMMSSMGTPAGLSSFLGGFATGLENRANAERESDYVVSLKLLTKTSEITKQKALDRLLELMKSTSDEVLLRFASATVETIIQHARHPKPTIRASSYQLLQALMSKNKELKKTIVPELKVLSGVWVMGMNDMETAVSQAAAAAFDAAFPAEKKTLMLQQFMDAIMVSLRTAVEEVMASKKPLQDDSLDPNANRIYAALKSMGYMVKQVSAAQTAVLKFVQDPQLLGALLPPREAPKSYLLVKTPLARSAVLALLRDVVSFCPATPKVHQLVSQALFGSILDPNVAMASRTWELLLFWCRSNVSDVVSHMKGGFLDDVVNCFMGCQQGELGEVIFPCLFPLLTSLSKDARCEGILDEFCAALVERLSVMSETPNVSAHDLEVVLTALMECWELHCVRKKTSRASEDSVELLTVISFNVVKLIQTEAKATRYQAVIIATMAKSLLKTANRCEDVFRQCLTVIGAQPGAAFRVLPDSPEPAVQRSFSLFQARLLGRLCASTSTPLPPVPAATTTSPTTRTEGASTAHCKALAADVANKWLLQQVAVSPDEHKWVQLAAFFDETRDTQFFPSDAVADAVLGILCAYVRHTHDEETSAQAHTRESRAALATLVKAGLEWKHRPASQDLMEATSSTQEHTLKEAALRHLMQDPARLCEVLTCAVAQCDVAGVSQCVAVYVERELNLSEEQRRGVLEALCTSVKETLAMVTESAADSDAGSATTSDSASSYSSSKTSPTSSASSSASSSSTSDSGLDSDTADADTSAAGGGDTTNLAPEARERMKKWGQLLRSGGAFAGLLHLDAAYVVGHLLKPLSYISAAVATRVFVEQYISVKAMRIALQRQQYHIEGSGSSGSEGNDDLVAYAMERKVHWSSIADCNAVTAEVEELLDSYSVRPEDRDAVAMDLLHSVFSNDDDLPLSFFAVYRLPQLAPYASTACLQSFATSESVWQQAAVEVQAAALASNESALSLYDGYLSLDLLRPTFTTTVRTAQLVRLTDSVDGAAAAVAMANVDPKAVARVFCQLLRVAASKEVLADGVCRTLFGSVFPAMLACFDVAEVAVEVAAIVTSTEGPMAAAGVPYLLPTLAAVLRDVAPAEDTVFLRRAIRLVSAVSSTAVTALFHAEGAKGVSPVLAAAYTTFFSVLDEVADMLRFNIAAQLPAEQERLLLEASCQLPMWDLTTAKLTLVVLRHLASLPAVADSTVKGLIAYASKQTPLSGLELLAELSCTHIPTPDVYSELIRVIIDALCRCHRLRHLPPNGRLQKESGGSLMGSAPAALTTLRRVVMAAVLARRGVVLHSRMDSVLRSTVNLVVFDAVCEAVSQLRSTKEGEVAPLAKLIAFTSRFMGDLLTSDVMTLRGSETSVEKIASVLCFAYAWLFATSIAKLEQLGVSTVAGVIRSVCLLANLTLMRATVPLAVPMQFIMQRFSLKPLREEYSTAQPAKVAQFRQQNLVLTKTQKQKMLLFPYLLSWCVYLTSVPPPPTEEAQGTGSNVARDKDWQRQVYTLLDLLFALMLTPMERASTRLDSTFIGASLNAGTAGDSSATGPLGFELVALTRVDAPDQMAQLARGAFAVFTQLLHGNTLSLTKSWLETVERKGRSLFYSSVDQHITGILIQESFLSVLRRSPDGSSSFSVGDSCSVEVNVAQQLIDLSYEMEDAKVAVRITFPPAFPLHPPVVEHETGRECGVSMKKWRSWMLKMSVILFGGSANVWECIDLFHQNLDAHFRGIEPCPICFAVVSPVNHKLPDVRCSVCHNSAFHSNCLYTWWATGSNNVCPLCRSPWIAE
ncbi:conserved hypothetical protein [Leishmania infantum JPCM5]|uniref:E3 ubiquitin-protein ligase listerin n=2 Tax=Leishmania infantum TaxID=5671 RepID=A0A6L0XP91_LEIIN|nr:conserved hypothetical protein [Leishmania infantum JPCM5]CAC9490938.1 hypothetical_protein_-_conserved [Leishmania infantum]CBZ08710.1 conserved hypothetical protein [Leishmania infantum JPCM5]SUZ42108.1 hypothetical_protein_-_conserved [Leishmania infantum]|eukprot:XP_003392542.1 conserved hypothetical protein [Leishmania infantum JPCM5]